MGYIKAGNNLNYGGLGYAWGFGERGERGDVKQAAEATVSQAISMASAPISIAPQSFIPIATGAAIDQSAFAPSMPAPSMMPAPIQTAPIQATPIQTAPIQTSLPTTQTSLFPYLYPGYMLPGMMPYGQMPRTTAQPTAPVGASPLSLPTAIYIGPGAESGRHLQPDQYQIRVTPQQARLGSIAAAVAVGLLFL